MYQIKVNGGEALTVEGGSDAIQVSGKSYSWDLRRLPGGSWSLISNGKHYEVLLEQLDVENKQMVLRINNRLYTAELKEPLDQLLEKMGLNMQAGKKAEAIKAPMPGLILKILVEPGQEIKKGDPVLVLEAMKMENVFKAAGDAQVKNILVQAGQAVEKGTVLIELS